MIEYDDNIELITILDSHKGTIGVFPHANQISQLNKTDKDLMNQLVNSYGHKNQYISFHRIKKELFYVKHTARDVEYTINGFIKKNKDEISQGIVDTICNSLPSIVKIY